VYELSWLGTVHRGSNISNLGSNLSTFVDLPPYKRSNIDGNTQKFYDTVTHIVLFEVS